jgi:hypothetical protein
MRRAMERLTEALKSRANQLRCDNRRQACLKFAHTSARLVYASGPRTTPKVFLESGADLAGKVLVEILSD